MVHFSLALSVTGTYRLHFLAEKTEGLEHTGCWMSICWCTRARMTHQPDVHGRHHITNWKKSFYQKRTETSLHKSKGTYLMLGSLNERTGWQSTQTRSDMHSITWPHYSTGVLQNTYPVRTKHWMSVQQYCSLCMCDRWEPLPLPVHVHAVKYY